MRKKYTFRIPAVVYIEITAPSEAQAREVASDWQDHAFRWEHFALVEDITDFFDTPAGVDLDPTAGVYLSVDTNPELRGTDEADDDEEEEA